MIFSCANNKIRFSIICSLASLCCFTGCTSHNYKAEADEQVYRIIDQKWREDFGTKSNYRISDVAPSPNDIQIDKAVPACGTLSIPQAVALATAHNREYQSQKELLYTTALDLRLSRHEFETQYFGGLSGGYDADWNDKVVGLEKNWGFNRLLSTGTFISAKIANAWLDVLSGNMEGGIGSILTATIIQPLFRGADRKVVTENLTQAEQNVLYQIRLFNRFRKTFVVSVITQYYQVLELYSLTRIAEDNYNTITQLYERVEKLTKAGRLPLLELDRMQQEKLKAKDIYVQTVKEYGTLLDTFKITLGVPTTTEIRLDENNIETLRAGGMHYPDFDEEEAVETALCKRLDLINIAESVIDAQRKVYVAADALGVDLSIIGTTNIASQKQGSRQTMQAADDYSVNFDLSLPLDRVAEQNIYRKALITSNQRQREYDLAADTIKMEIRQAYRDLKEAIERYKLQSEGLELAQERFKKTFLLMQYARASSRRVLDAQNALFEAKSEATDALADYAIAMLNFYRDTGVIQVRPDGMWEKGTNKETPASELVSVEPSSGPGSGR
ncbi:MAG: TolC family protein [Sedimentisphaerales bacterium]|nr:TolC family protein [Sedimentisphaerales bacterium]